MTTPLFLNYLLWFSLPLWLLLLLLQTDLLSISNHLLQYLGLICHVGEGGEREGREGEGGREREKREGGREGRKEGRNEQRQMEECKIFRVIYQCSLPSSSSLLAGVAPSPSAGDGVSEDSDVPLFFPSKRMAGTKGLMSVTNS